MKSEIVWFVDYVVPEKKVAANKSNKIKKVLRCILYKTKNRESENDFKGC